jgi:hypothetical protein
MNDQAASDRWMNASFGHGGSRIWVDTQDSGQSIGMPSPPTPLPHGRGENDGARCARLQRQGTRRNSLSREGEGWGEGKPVGTLAHCY